MPTHSTIHIFHIINKKNQWLAWRIRYKDKCHHNSRIYSYNTR